MNKKYLSLGALVALAIVWFVGPIVSMSLFGVSADFTVLDMLDTGADMGLADILVAFAPIAAIVVGVIGTFIKPAIAKIGAIATTVAFIAGFGLYLDEPGTDYLGWGLYAMLVLLIVNVVLTIMAKKDEAAE